MLALALYFVQENKGLFTNASAQVPGLLSKSNKEKGGKEKNIEGKETAAKYATIEKEWQMPNKLKEISGLSVIDDKRFACIQDERGIIYIYNTSTEKIEQEIAFGKKKDYEDIAIAGNAAYVITSSGVITEINDYSSGNPSVKTYNTTLTAKENIEGLCYDAKNNRLLLAVKDKDANSKDYKGIYGFNLPDKKFNNEPIYRIDLNHEVFKKGKKKKSVASFSPSGISLHPQTGELYIVDGRTPRLLVMDGNNNIKSLLKLKNAAFSQPEGITFNQTGSLFIANEGTKNRGNILKVTIGEQGPEK